MLQLVSNASLEVTLISAAHASLGQNPATAFFNGDYGRPLFLDSLKSWLINILVFPKFLQLRLSLTRAEEWVGIESILYDLKTDRRTFNFCSGLLNSLLLLVENGL